MARFAEILSKHGLSLRTVAQHMGVSRQAVGQWSLGRTYPRQKKMAKLVKFLQKYDKRISLTDLIPKEGE